MNIIELIKNNKNILFVNYFFLITSTLLIVVKLFQVLADISYIIAPTLFVIFNIQIAVNSLWIGLSKVKIIAYMLLFNMFSSLILYLSSKYLLLYIDASWFYFSLVCLSLISALIVGYKQNQKDIICNKSILLSLLYLLVLFIFSKLIFWQGIPKYTTLNTDSLTHIVAMKEIFINGKLSLNLKEISNSFTVFSYFPLFHIILGPVILSNGVLNTINIYTILEAYFSLISAIVIFFLFRKESVFSGLLLATLHLLMFENISAFTSMFLLPQTFVALLFLIILKSILDDEITLDLLIFACFILFITHFFIGGVASLILFTMFILKKSSIPKYISFLLSLFSFLFLLSTILEKLSFFIFYRELFEDFSVRSAEFVIFDNFSYLVLNFQTLGFLIVPILLIVLFRHLLWKKDILIVSSFLLILSGMILADFPYASKFLLLIHYLIIFILADGLKYIIQINPKWKFFVLIILNIALLFTFTISTHEYKSIFLHDNMYELVNVSDYKLAEEFQDLKDSYIISDPLTMTIMEAQTNGKTLGGIYTKEEYRIQVWKFLNNVINDQELIESLNLKRGDAYLVINSRAVDWRDKDEEFINSYTNLVWRPSQDFNFVCSENFNDASLVYKSDFGCIYSL